MPLSNDKHLEIIQYFLADTEMNVIRLTDYIKANSVNELLTNNEEELIKDLLILFTRFNDQERKQWTMQSK
jgi:hypothetical protein